MSAMLVQSPGTPGSSTTSSVVAVSETQKQTSAENQSKMPDKSVSLSHVAGDGHSSQSHRSVKATPEENYLPADIRKILGEVAENGSCSLLPWNLRAEGSSRQANDTISSSTNGTATKGVVASAGTTPSNAVDGAKVDKVVGPVTKNVAQSHSPNSGQNVRPNPLRTGVGPQYKKHRNGLNSGRRRLDSTIGAKTSVGASIGRKRPLSQIRSTSNVGSATSGSSSGVGSNGVFPIGSVRTSSSEPDDATQYECDSEGTSATSNSELSDYPFRSRKRELNHPASSRNGAVVVEERVPEQPPYRCLKEVFGIALGLVLDHWYLHKGGYKLSPAEQRRNATMANASDHGGKSVASAASAIASGGENSIIDAKADPISEKETAQREEKPSAEKIFQQRRDRIVASLGVPKVDKNETPHRPGVGPPFTIQRIAEVLVAPERYYTQTHKLCNCLEKLLLVSSSTEAFGGSTGGVTSQSRREEREMAALADEKGRLESELRQRALRRRFSSASEDMALDSGTGVDGSPSTNAASRQEGTEGGKSPKKDSLFDGSIENELAASGAPSDSRKMLEKAAKALRTKFDHVGIDPHSHSHAISVNQDPRSIAENRGMTNSPPPPNATAVSTIALPGHGVGGFVRQHLTEQSNDHHASLARVPSPILFAPGTDAAVMTPLQVPPNMQILHHINHASLTGIGIGTSPFDVVTIEATGHTPSTSASSNLPGAGEVVDEGRSSASNSDVDSESDSFDDSASDRSDGSDSGHYESAARAMALNRIQQQQRLHNRVLTSLAIHQGDGLPYRPPADSEYQSGDSIDSTRGEDSCGSDSSSSDLAE